MKNYLNLQVLTILFFMTGSIFAQDKSILFIVGADGTVGFFEGGVNDHKASITDPSTSNGNHGWKELSDALQQDGFSVAEITEGAGGSPVQLDQMNLSQYDVIVFGSNNAVYTNSQVQAFSDYIIAGGSALFISDANFGEYWSDAPNSDQQFIGQFGWTMNQDRGTYSVLSSEFVQSNHPILSGISRFDGEGVSPITLSNSNVPGVTSTIIARVPSGQQVRRNNSAGTGQGSSSSATANDAALIVAEVGQGRVAGHFDRNTFFNLNGAGTNINRFDNKAFALNLFNWLSDAEASETPLVIPGRIEAEDYHTYSDSTNGNSGGAYRNDDVDIQTTNDSGGGFNVGWIAAGESLSYNVNIAEAGQYEVTFRVASQQTGNKSLHIEVDGQNVSGPVTFNTNGNGWQSFQNVTAELALPAGSHVLKVVMDSPSFNLNYIDFEKLGSDLPNGQTVADVGNTAFDTLVAHDNGTYLISASGRDIWGSNDAFGFLSQDFSGDVELSAKIDSIENTNPWAKAGVMIRESLAANSKHAMTVITPAQGVSFQRRTATGSNSGHNTIGGVSAPEYVRLIRSGSKFTSYFSSGNNVWFPINSVNFSMNANVKVGLAVTSHNNSTETEAMISEFSVSNPASNLSVTRLVLVNADTDQDIREIYHNETISLSQDGANLSIRAETSGNEESIVFHINGSVFQTESAAVYALAGNNGSDYNAWTPATGSHTIMATPYSENSGNGSAGASLAIVINVVN